MKREVLILVDSNTKFILASEGVWLLEAQQEKSGQEEKEVRVFLPSFLGLALWPRASHMAELSLGHLLPLDR